MLTTVGNQRNARHETGHSVGAAKINDDERKKRFLKREGNLDKFSDEEHLDLWHLTDMNDLHLVNVRGDEFSAFANFINSIKNIKKSIDF